MNIKLKVIIALILIAGLAFFLRFYKLSSVPPSPSLDEVSIGYNAYSILKTGGDEYGTKFPVLLRAYDDWRPALYVYLVIPFVQLFGLTTQAVRFPSVILSVLTVLATYFLAKKLFSNSVALFAALFLAISPWHIYISRLGHEVNAGLAFFVFAVTFFLRKNIFIAVVCFTLSFISYQSEKIFLPLFLVGLLFLFRKEVLEQKKKFLLAGLFSLIVLIPFIKATLEPNALIRIKATNILEANKERFDRQTKLLADAVKNNDVVGKIKHNRRTVVASIFLESYISHFDPKWLFTNTSNDRHKVPNLGLFYIWEALFLPIGLFYLLTSHIEKKIKILVLSWILISPLPGAITTDAPHVMRAFTMLPMLSMLSAFGTGYIFDKFVKVKKTLFVFIIILGIISLYTFYKNYFFVFPKTQSSSFQYALSKAVPFVLEHEKTYNKIVFSNKDNLYQSYMFFLFFSGYDPILYQKQGGTVSGGFAQTHAFDNYEFRPLRFEQESQKNVLYVGNSYDFPTEVLPTKIFYELSGKESIFVLEK